MNSGGVLKPHDSLLLTVLRRRFLLLIIVILSRFCEPNNQLNVCTTSVTEGEVARVKLV